VATTIKAKALTDEQKEEKHLLHLRYPAVLMVRYTPNKVGRIDVDYVADEMTSLENVGIGDQVLAWKKKNSRFNLQDNQWQITRNIAPFAS
jgi:hypothetical protein